METRGYETWLIILHRCYFAIWFALFVTGGNELYNIRFIKLDTKLELMYNQQLEQLKAFIIKNQIQLE